MGRRETFFRPYLSGIERARPLVELGIEYHIKFDRYRAEKPDIAGVDKFLFQSVLNDVYELGTQKKFVSIRDYNFFAYSGEKVTGCDYYDRIIKELSRRVICSDPLGTNLYFNSIFGLTMFDLYEVDYLTFKEYDKMAITIAEDFIKEMQERQKKTKQNNPSDFVI